MSQTWQQQERSTQQSGRQTSQSGRSEAQRSNRSNPNPDEVRSLAYKLWEQAGRPDGQSDQFWISAEQQLSKNR